MTTTKRLTRLDVIRMLGDELTNLDVTRSDPSLDKAVRKQLDGFRDDLDTCQRRLVKNALNDNAAAFKNSAKALKAVNDELKAAAERLDQLAKTLELLVKLVEAAQKIAALAT